MTTLDEQIALLDLIKQGLSPILQVKVDDIIESLYRLKGLEK